MDYSHTRVNSAKSKFLPLFRLAFILCILAGSRFVLAVPIIVSADRSVSVGDNSGTTFSGSDASTSGIFNHSVSDNFSASSSAPIVSKAVQNTSINASLGQLTGAGNTDIGTSTVIPRNDSGIFASSFFDVFFDITVSHNFGLNATLNNFLDGGDGNVTLLLQDAAASSPPIIDIDVSSLITSFSGLLAAGSYRLTVIANLGPDPTMPADGFYSGTTNFDFTLNMREAPGQSVPEPATLLLLGLGLAGIGFSRRKAA